MIFSHRDSHDAEPGAPPVSPDSESVSVCPAAASDPLFSSPATNNPSLCDSSPT